jgi:small-conductance mechanosensitive channel
MTWGHAALIAGIVLGGALLVQVTRLIVGRAAESALSHRRLLILRTAPLARLAIGLCGLVLIVPILVEPNFEDIVALLATVGLAIAFAIKDYVSSLIAGIVTILENPYQPGDWIEFGGAYGEVRVIGMRAVRLVTTDNTEVVIPHAKIWANSIFNASGGRPNLQTVTSFYIHPDHDADAVAQALREVAETGVYPMADASIRVTASETPFGTHYKIKAFVSESRDQFSMITDHTLRGRARLRAMGVKFAQAPVSASLG